MSKRRWANVSWLDAIRPEPTWRTRYAIISSYSGDLVALVAAMLSLAGLDDDRGSGSKVDFANAIEQLTDRVRLLVQSGRLVAPNKSPRILTILDRFVREVAFDESHASWHPKAVLVRHDHDGDDASEWRLWIGSRNLTRDLSWDVGLTLIGRATQSDHTIDGIPELAEEMAGRAQLPGLTPKRLRSELQQVRWTVPAGCEIRSLRLLTADTSRGLPPEPTGLRRLLVVSPFMDGGITGELGRWGDPATRRQVLSTRTELTKLAHQKSQPLEGFQDLLFLDAPPPDEASANDVADRANSTSQDEDPEPRGLHAKLILAETNTGCTLWTGSANATQRGWNGPNSEIVVKLDVKKEIVAGLEDFVSSIAKAVTLDELGAEEESSDIDERLESARVKVAAEWSVHQRIDEAGPLLFAETSPHPKDPNIELRVGLLGAPLVTWPHDALQLQLPHITQANVTELVCCQLSLEDVTVSWLQRAPLDPPPNDERDRQALARYLDPRTFLQWIRSLLTDSTDGEGGGEWDGDRPSRLQSRPDAGPNWWAPTIEEVLRSWGRDPAGLQMVDRKVRHYLKLYQAQSDNELSQDDLKVINEFQQTWRILRGSLVEDK